MQKRRLNYLRSRPHRTAMYIVAFCYRRCSVVCLSVGRSVTIVSPAKSAEPVDTPFRLWTRVGQWKHILYEVAQWRHLANTIEPSICGGCDDAAFLSNYCDHLFSGIATRTRDVTAVCLHTKCSVVTQVCEPVVDELGRSSPPSLC